jgi:hypothetical protein
LPLWIRNWLVLLAMSATLKLELPVPPVFWMMAVLTTAVVPAVRLS